MGELKCLNPWDPQSKRQYRTDGVYGSLYAGVGSGQQTYGVCYAIDQQGGKSNAGYAEDVMVTLMSDSHGTPHGVCYALEGNGSRPSHQGGGGTAAKGRCTH